jgi:hypothetical protein
MQSLIRLILFTSRKATSSGEVGLGFLLCLYKDDIAFVVFQLVGCEAVKNYFTLGPLRV